MRAALLIVSALTALGAPANPAAAQRAERGWIGIALEVQTGERWRSDGPVVLIDDVRDGSPAAEAGLRPGDRVLAINDLRGSDDFLALPERLRLRVGQRVRVRIERDGRRREVSMRAAERPRDLRSRVLRITADADAAVESMVRAMDSLRVQLVGVGNVRERDASTDPRRSADLRISVEQTLEGMGAPFEFFIFRGEEHDSLRQAMEDLNRLSQELQRTEQVRLAEVAQRLVRPPEDVEVADDELRVVRAALEEVRREAAQLRAAMSEAARNSAGLDYARPGWSSPVPTPPAPTTRQRVPTSDSEPAQVFRPLTPYVVGSNMIAGAQVIDVRPRLAQYFEVDDGVLVVDVLPGTPAALAGIVPGDVVIRIDQVTIRSVEQLRFAVSQASDSLPISLVRQGTTLETLLSR